MVALSYEHTQLQLIYDSWGEFFYSWKQAFLVAYF